MRPIHARQYRIDGAREACTIMKNAMLVTFTACLLAATAAASDFVAGRLDNWHQWRGPEANGTVPRGDPPMTWDEQTNIKWKAPLSGRGSATPIVWGDRVFVLTAVKTDRVAETAPPNPDPRFEKKTTAPNN